jgi:16S rRNA (uracil1498-N3)-methyltransferase
MQLFYTPGLTNELFQLSDEEARHCSQVLRLKIGDRLYSTDGEGHLFESEIKEINKKHTLIGNTKVIETITKNRFQLHIAIAPTKNAERFEWFLEKAVEIGIDEITPLICEHSERKTVNIDRCNKILISAMKQSLKKWRPIIHQPIKFKEFVSEKTSGMKFIAYCNNETTSHLKDIYTKNADAIVLIGPEGDFSASEVERSINNGFEPVSLGKSRLRTETAGVFACSIINIINE